MAFGDAVERVQDMGGESALFQLLGSPRGVFQDIMQDGDDLLVFGVDGHHDAERVKDVRLAVLLFLAGVGFSGDLNGGVEQGVGHLVVQSLE